MLAHVRDALGKVWESVLVVAADREVFGRLARTQDLAAVLARRGL